jgi:hypothetical protein
MNNPWLIAMLVVCFMFLIVLGTLMWLLVCERLAREAAQKKWAEILNEISAQHTKDLEQMLVLRGVAPSQNGSSPHIEPIIIPHETDAEERANRAVSEHVMMTGMSALREAYRTAGVSRTDDELRVEVESVANGTAAWR